MIDWFRGELPFLHDPLPAGRVLSIDPDGTVEWESVKSLLCRGSFESSIKVKSSGGNGEGRATALLVDGNLAKFLQGHNIFGIEDLDRLVLLAFRRIVELHAAYFQGSADPALTEARIKRGDYWVKMLDITRLFDVGNDASVEAWLHAAHMRAVSRHGRSSRDRGTVYMGQHSRRWAFKFYNKFRELSAKFHRLPEELKGLGLEEFVDGKLRAELRLFARELQERHGITHGHHLTPAKLDQLFNDYLGKIDMTMQATLLDEQLTKMPRTLLGTYQLWRQGADVRYLLAQNTFYRHRRALLEYGVDINVPHLAPERNNVVPLIRIVEAVPVVTPQWAYDKKLIAL